MQKLCSVVGAILVASTAIGAPVTYEGTLGDGTTPFSEFFADTKGSASSKTPWVHPTNVVNLASKESARLITLQQSNGSVDSSDLPYGGIWPTGYTFKDYVDYVWKSSILTLGEKEDALYAKIGPFSNVSTNVFGVKKGNIAIGGGANAATNSYGQPLGIVAINPYGAYPSYAYGSFNTVIGIDNVVGYGDDGAGGVLKNGSYTPNAATYSVAIGVSNRAQYQHDYVFGSQANAFAANSTVIGYGASSTDTYSVVIGHGKRPTSGGIDLVEKKFSSDEAWQAWLKTANNANIRRGVTFANTSSNPRVYYVITKVLTTPDENGYYAEILEVPEESLDIVAGKYDWRYGKSHGRGTFNIVAYNGGTVSPGLSAVYINDDRLDDLVKQGYVLILTPSQIASGVTFVKDGYYQNSAVEIGADAKASLDQSYVSSYTSTAPLRNVGVAIGARADATNPSTPGTSQGVAVGYCARAQGGQSIAIGPGAVRLDSEDNDTGNNAYAKGGTSIAIGYNTKAYGEKSVAIGSGNGGTVIASNNYSVAMGFHAVAAANGAVQIGEGINTSPNSLQFRGVKIVENGRLVGGSADPKEAVISSDVISAAGGEISINLEPGSISTILPEANCGPGTEVMVEAPVGGLRNYEVYLPNEPEMCAGLPAGFSLDELPEGIKGVYVNNKWQAHKLPARIIIKQPYSRLVIGEIVEFDDGTDWSPIITDAHVVWNSGKFVTDGNKLLEGTNLHSGVSLKIAYPLSDTTTCTNTIWGASDINDQGILNGTFYNYVISAEYTTKSGENLHSLDNDGNTWVEFIYETKCGKTPAVFRKQFNMY